MHSMKNKHAFAEEVLPALTQREVQHQVEEQWPHLRHSMGEGVSYRLLQVVLQGTASNMAC